MTLSPTVSIGMPVYNGDRFLERALISLSNQTFEDFEILISDNGSTDRTAEICQEYEIQDRRIRYWRQDKNRGAAWNYNFTTREASGNFFKWAAHDDECAPRFLALCIETFNETDASTVLCYPRTLFIDEQSEVFAKFLDNLSLPSKNPDQRLYRLVSVISRCNPVFGLIRAECLNKTKLIGNYIGADKVPLAELCLMGKFQEIPEFLFLRRMHEGISTSAAQNERELLAWFDPEKRSWPLPFSRLRLMYEYLGAVARADLSSATRRACYRSLWRSYFRRIDPNSAAFAQEIGSVEFTNLSERLDHVKKLIETDDLSNASQRCRAILNTRPFTTLALHLMSVIHHRSGELERAKKWHSRQSGGTTVRRPFTTPLASSRRL